MIDRHATRGVYRRVTPAVLGWEDGRVDDIIPWFRAQIDRTEWWAREASRRDDNCTPTGEHWRWEDSDTDQPIDMDPATGDTFTGSLRSVEEYPTSSSVGPLPHFVIHTAEDVTPAVGGHIIRNDPARVLRQVAADRRILAEYEQLLFRDPLRVGPAWDARRDTWETAVRMRAEAYDDQPGYQEMWRLT